MHKHDHHEKQDHEEDCEGNCEEYCQEWTNKRWSHHRWHGYHRGHGGNAVYGLGFVGALLYFVSTASGFGMAIVGFLKACVWPAFLAYEALKFLGNK